MKVPVERENNPLALDGDVTAQLHNPFMSVVPVVHNLANLHRPNTVVGARGKFIKTYGPYTGLLLILGQCFGSIQISIKFDS